MTSRSPLFKSAKHFEEADRNARLYIEKMLDRYYHRKPLTLYEILIKAQLIPDTLTTPDGEPIKRFLATGAYLLKDNPEELYNYYLTEIKPHLK